MAEQDPELRRVGIGEGVLEGVQQHLVGDEADGHRPGSPDDDVLHFGAETDVAALERLASNSSRNSRMFTRA
jgi:hypothetical protein